MISSCTKADSKNVTNVADDFERWKVEMDEW